MDTPFLFHLGTVPMFLDTQTVFSDLTPDATHSECIRALRCVWCFLVCSDQCRVPLGEDRTLQMPSTRIVWAKEHFVMVPGRPQLLCLQLFAVSSF